MNCDLKPGHCLVWWIELDAASAAVMADWRSCLDAAEQASADRFHFDVDRCTYIAAHWLIRQALTAVGDLPPHDWRFVAGPYGKPEIDPALGRSALRFNLTHTRHFAACAVAIGSSIGIDVEALDRRSVDLDVAARFFSSAELATLRATAPASQHETFLRFWTLKEALIKATGEGLHRPLDSFSFTLDPVRVRFHPDDPDEAARWTFAEHRPTPRHALAVAMRPSSAGPLSLSIRGVQSAEHGAEFTLSPELREGLRPQEKE